VAVKEKEIVELEKESVQPDFWLDQAKAQSKMRQLAEKRRVVQTWRGLERRTTDLSELLTLAEGDSALLSEIEKEIKTITTELEDLEFQFAFGGEFDNRNAILTIHAGAGGTESQDWAAMLMRMYLRWAERRGYKAEILDLSPGEEAGVKSVVIGISGEYASGYLKSEHGVHRLVRLSPFDADHGRHTSFALVEVMPEAAGDVDVKIEPEELKIDTYRSSAPGGQHMQKSSSAVRITHLPTGLIVTCQTERSQHQNKETAMRILMSRLLEKRLEQKAEEQAKLKGKRISAGWGNQIRSYVLHPYKMVKDHRTDLQSGNPEAALDGELDDFINAYLRSGLGRDQW
jgi:peptide chain release factor 2